MLVQESGKLDGDAGIHTYLPELPKRQSNPTLRQLMSHTGGARCYLDLSLISNGPSPIPAGAELEYQSMQSGGNFAPGAQMIYSNGGYHLLSLAIERAAAQPLEIVFSQRIFEPLGMRDTLLLRDDMALLPGVAAP